MVLPIVFIYLLVGKETGRTGYHNEVKFSSALNNIFFIYPSPFLKGFFRNLKMNETSQEKLCSQDTLE